MKVAFALLADNHMHNHMRRLAYELNRDHGVGFLGSQLPPHISLKQPFPVRDIRAVEAYLDGFASSTAPVDVRVRGLYLYPSESPIGVFHDVVETPQLRRLHERVNAELTERFGNAEAPFDGDEYHFHATIALGIASGADSYDSFLAANGADFRYDFVAREAIMFYYGNDHYELGTFMTYKVLPLLGE